MAPVSIATAALLGVKSVLAWKKASGSASVIAVFLLLMLLIAGTAISIPGFMATLSMLFLLMIKNFIWTCPFICVFLMPDDMTVLAESLLFMNSGHLLQILRSAAFALIVLMIITQPISFVKLGYPPLSSGSQRNERIHRYI